MDRSQTRRGPAARATRDGLDTDERRTRNGVVVAAAAATAGVIWVLNVGTGPGASRLPLPPPSPVVESPSGPPTDIGLRRVPDTVGRPMRVAGEMLRTAGLSATFVHRFVACTPADTAVEQDPLPGVRIPGGSEVAVVVSDPRSEELRCPEGIALDRDHALVGLLHGFGRGVAGARPPTAAAVGLGLRGAAPSVVLTGREVHDLDRWRVVPPDGDPADALPLLDALVASRGDYRVDVGPHPTCGGPDRAPAQEFAGYRQLSITPTAPRTSCVDWWAVDVFVDGRGRIRGVNLDLWEP